jgi:hypothetical protein
MCIAHIVARLSALIVCQCRSHLLLYLGQGGQQDAWVVLWECQVGTLPRQFTHKGIDYTMLLRHQLTTLSRRRLTLAVFSAIVVFQLGVPLAQLWAPRPARWGWQMYATLSSTPTFTVVLKTGTVQPVDPAAYVTLMRTEIDFATVLPPHICHMMPDAVAVRIQQSQTSQLGEYSCH